MEGEQKDGFDVEKLQMEDLKVNELGENDCAEAEILASNPKPSKIIDEIEESPGMTFSPPIYIQRYCRVTEILKEYLEYSPEKRDREKLETVFEVGCAEFSMHVYLSKFKRVGKLIYLDLDENLLTDSAAKLRPLMIEHIRKRESPLRVEAYAGCVTKIDPIVLNAPIKAVIAIEIVEHLDPDILSGFVKSIFGIVRPELVIITTPNLEFNVCFNIAPGKFRHWDHRFEWTRDEFHAWCKSVCETYPSYIFTLEGVGEGPPETAGLGCVSQLAIFRNVNGSVTPEISKDIEPGSCFKLISEQDYPFYFDKSPLQVKIVRQFKYYVQSYLFTPTSIDDYIEEGVTEVKFPLTQIQHIHGIPEEASLEQIRSALEAADYKTIDRMTDEGKPETCVVLPVPEDICNYSSSSGSEYDDGDTARVNERFSTAASDNVEGEEEEW